MDFESFRVAAVQSESLADNLPLALVQHLQKLPKFAYRKIPFSGKAEQAT